MYSPDTLVTISSLPSSLPNQLKSSSVSPATTFPDCASSVAQELTPNSPRRYFVKSLTPSLMRCQPPSTPFHDSSPGPTSRSNRPPEKRVQCYEDEDDTDQFFSNTLSTAYATNEVRSVRHCVRSSIMGPSRSECSSKVPEAESFVTRDKSLSFLELNRRPPLPPSLPLQPVKLSQLTRALHNTVVHRSQNSRNGLGQNYFSEPTGAPPLSPTPHVPQRDEQDVLFPTFADNFETPRCRTNETYNQNTPEIATVKKAFQSCSNPSDLSYRVFKRRGYIWWGTFGGLESVYESRLELAYVSAKSELVSLEGFSLVFANLEPSTLLPLILPSTPEAGCVIRADLIPAAQLERALQTSLPSRPNTMRSIYPRKQPKIYDGVLYSSSLKGMPLYIPTSVNALSNLRREQLRGARQITLARDHELPSPACIAAMLSSLVPLREQPSLAQLESLFLYILSALKTQLATLPEDRINCWKRMIRGHLQLPESIEEDVEEASSSGIGTSALLAAQNSRLLSSLQISQLPACQESILPAGISQLSSVQEGQEQSESNMIVVVNRQKHRPKQPSVQGSSLTGSVKKELRFSQTGWGGAASSRFHDLSRELPSPLITPIRAKEPNISRRYAGEQSEERYTGTLVEDIETLLFQLSSQKKRAYNY